MRKWAMAFVGLLPGMLLAPGCVKNGGCYVPERREPAEMLASWRDTPTRDAIIEFVEAADTWGGKDYIPPKQRIAVFDNDGCLWAEQPAYFQLIFAMDRVREMSPDHPEWSGREPYASAIAGDTAGVIAQGTKGVLELIAVSHAGTTIDEFSAIAREWLRTARHPTTGMLYTEMVYQPMLEVMEYMRDRGFKTYVVSGGGVEFMRAFAEEVYGVPPEQVIGSNLEVVFEVRDGVPVLVQQPGVSFIDDRVGKPVRINTVIGRRPVAAFGSSDGDMPMLQWITGGSTPGLGVLIHHTDAEREWAYDRGSLIGRMDKALDEAPGFGWVVVDMARDWDVVFPADQ
ncbi:MAG: HAD family hydrolase [Phycisphaerales bacterium]|nr:HAD family hydrolase [Phycisphaerales bacterium]